MLGISTRKTCLINWDIVLQNDSDNHNNKEMHNKVKLYAAIGSCPI